MSLVAPVQAVCCSTSLCQGNLDQRVTAVCSRCGKCGSCTLHGNCEAMVLGGLSRPTVSTCSNDSCLNCANAVNVLVCSVCRRCGDCSLHSACSP